MRAHVGPVGWPDSTLGGYFLSPHVVRRGNLLLECRTEEKIMANRVTTKDLLEAITALSASVQMQSERIAELEAPKKPKASSSHPKDELVAKREAKALDTVKANALNWMADNEVHKVYFYRFLKKGRPSGAPRFCRDIGRITGKTRPIGTLTSDGRWSAAA